MTLYPWRPPLRVSTGGGDQLTVKLLGLLALTRTLVGAAEGTVDGIERRRRRCQTFIIYYYYLLYYYYYYYLLIIIHLSYWWNISITNIFFFSF